MTLSQQVNSGTATTTLLPATVALGISLGSKPGGTLGLNASDLNNITAGALQLGNTTTFTGNIDVTANIIAACDLEHAQLFSSTGTVRPNPAARSTVANLVPNAGGGVTLNNSGNTVGAIWGGTNGTNNAFGFTNSTSLTVGGPAPGNTQGLKTGGGSVTIAAGGSGSLTVLGNVGIDTTNVAAVPHGAEA